MKPTHASLVDANMFCWRYRSPTREELPILPALSHDRGGVESTCPPRLLLEQTMATPEATVKKHIRNILNEKGVYYAMPIGTGYGNSGVPDFLVCHQGKFIGIEAKAGTNRPTTLQEDHLYRIRNAGGITLVVNETNLNELRRILE